MTGTSLVQRRRFLRVLAACTCSGAACSGSVTAPDPIGQVAAGVVDDYPVGSLRAIGNQPVAVGRDADGFFAMTLTCSHAGCNLAVAGSITPERLRCNCHGAEFDGNGEVLRGPAIAPLQHFDVLIDSAGNVSVDGGTQVPADFRTPA